MSNIAVKTLEVLPHLTLPSLVTFHQIKEFTTKAGVKFLCRSYVSMLMQQGRFPLPVDLHKRPMHWKREDILAWLNKYRGLDTSLYQE